ncbi:MAG: hypothetical protein JWL57_3550 [Actinobacteria bacterium]|nr:hypothetical protein [Actinomycetota bacterium]
MGQPDVDEYRRSLPPDESSRPSKRGRVALVVAIALLALALAILTSVRHTAPPARRGIQSAIPVDAFWSPAFTTRQSGSFGDQNMEVIPEPAGRFPLILRVHYPKGSASELVKNNNGAPVGGGQRYLVPRNSVPADSLALRYFVRFPNGFDFVKGGKLPGLYGGIQTSGRRIPDGTNGLSTRYMWRAGGAGEVYAYLPTSQEHGTSIGRGNWTFSTGTWHEIQQEIVLNDVGKGNGRITVWFDGKRVLAETGVLFRSSASLQIEGVLFSTFFGGGDSTWATPVDTYADFADFTVSPHAVNEPAAATTG